MRNLMGDAMLHAGRRPRARHRGQGDGGRCKLNVSDGGPGIPASERDVVLRRFHRLNHGNEPGSRLGLAIVAWNTPTSSQDAFVRP
jgi:K+-sensing histidine kinase KdpD